MIVILVNFGKADFVLRKSVMIMYIYELYS